MKTDLSKYDNSWYNPGSAIKRIIWYIVSMVFVRSNLFPFSALKRILLRLFGAKVGDNVVIKPRVNIKYPWKLSVGENTWIGEGVWIDNVDQVSIGSNACLSQDVYVLCGSHDYTKSTFDLKIKPIVIEEGVWLGAQSVVSQGVKCKSHAILSVKSVALRDLEPYGIYQGNPAKLVYEREIKS